MTFALLFFNNLKLDFQRLEARQSKYQRGNKEDSNGLVVSSATYKPEDQEGEARKREHQHRKTDLSPKPTKTTSNDVPYLLQWQAYPPRLGHCLDWTADLLTGFRGVNWNFRDPTLSKIERSKGDEQISDVTIESDNRSSIETVRKEALLAFLRLYLVTDVLKLIQSKDPYFQGQISLGSSHPELVYAEPMFLLKFCRMIISVLSVYSALTFIFMLCPIFFTIIPLVAPSPHILSMTRIPLLSPSMYERYWGPLFPSIASKGLAGFWGRFWHQLFRFGVSQPSAYIIKRYKLNSRSNTARAIQVLTAFCLSGTIHACASYTSFPPIPGTTHPITGPWAFFMSQGVGILMQASITRTIGSRSFPLWLRQAGNVVFVLVWLYFTGPLLADDFARCGVWLFEPLPISLVRGVRGERWWRWGGRWAGWWTDPQGRWWKSGIAVY